MADDDTRDRLIALEVEVRHLTRKVDEAVGKVRELHELLTAARGARWVLSGIIAVVSFVGGVSGGKIAAWFGILPR